MKQEEDKFFVINTRGLWEGGESLENLRVTEEGVTLESSNTYAYEDTVIPGAIVAVSLALDPCGTLYILDKNERDVYISPRSITAPRWLGSPYVDFQDPLSVAVIGSDIYVVDRVDSGGLISLHIYCISQWGGEINWQLEISENARIAAIGNGELYVLDVDAGKVFTVQAGGQWQPLENSIPLTGAPSSLAFPIDISADSEGNIYILEADNRVLLFSPDGQYIETITIPFEEGAQFLNLAVESRDRIHIGFETGGAGSSSQVRLSIAQLGQAVRHEVSGVYVTRELDSTIPNCHWHRVRLDVDIPSNTLTKLSYSASETPGAVPPDFGGHFNAAPLTNPLDALLNGAIGRYIRFRIQLFSDETLQGAPMIRSLKIHFPRDTYLRYLPGTYREDVESLDFTQRFLSLFETFMRESEATVSNITRYLDPVAAPDEFIAWLSGWLSLTIDENWSRESRRQLLREAPALYKRRGTRGYISRIMEIYWGEAPITVEHFQLEDVENAAHRDLLTRLYCDHACAFTVLVEPRWEECGDTIKIAKPILPALKGTLKRIVETGKPAHTSARLHMLQPWFYLDMHTYLGINSVLTQPRFVVGQNSVIGRDTRLEDYQ